MAHRAISEQPFSFFLLSGHDYEKATLRDNGPCIPCLAPIHKVGMLTLLHPRTWRCSFIGFIPDVITSSILEEHMSENGKETNTSSFFDP